MAKTTIYGAYSPQYDMTFIVKEQIYEDKITIEVTGFYYGEPNDEDTKMFDGDLLAELEI